MAGCGAAPVAAYITEGAHQRAQLSCSRHELLYPLTLATCHVRVAEWDEFKKLDFKQIYSTMTKPAFVFDGEQSHQSHQACLSWRA
jgi:hypothetical protein